MMRLFCIIFCLLLVVPAFALDNSIQRNLDYTDGSESFVIPADAPGFTPCNELDEVVGDTIHVGFSYYDFQHNGTVGRMIAVKEDETYGQIVEVYWMYTGSESDDIRHIRINRAWWDGTTPHRANDAGGWTVDTGQRAGYVCLGNNPEMDRITATYHSRSGAADDWFNTYSDELALIPGVFSNYMMDDTYPSDNRFIWPKVAMGPDGTLHIVTTEQRDGNTDEQYQLYYRIPAEDFLDPGDIEPVVITSHGMNISADIAVSEDGNTVVIGQTVSRDYIIHNLGSDAAGQGNNDIYLYISEDGGLNFNDPLNITNFIEPDYTLLPDTLAANQDTLRAYTDMNIIIDYEDIIHVAYGAHGFKFIQASGSGGFVMSKIYHWDNNSEVWTQAADGYFFNRNPGDWQSIALRPSQYRDPETGILWLAYQQYGVPGDTIDVGDNGWPNGEIFITASPNGSYNGKLWATPVNLTNTRVTEAGGGVAGSCYNERDMSLALYNPGEYLHMTYIQDLHSASAVREEDGAEWTNNPIVYHRVSKEEVIGMFDSWLENYPMHVNEADHWVDDHDYAWEPWGFYRDEAVENQRSEIPADFQLEQNYPNPFNPTTSIGFTLQNPGKAKLAVYDIQGREVAVLANRHYSGGHHEVTFHAEDFASGIYFTRLEMNGAVQTIKMALVK